MNNWTQIMPLADIPILGSVILNTDKQQIAVFRTRDNQVFALHNLCPHQGGMLAEGIVHGHKVTCPLHNWVISLKNGQVQGVDQGQTACFNTKIENDIVYVKL